MNNLPELRAAIVKAVPEKEWTHSEQAPNGKHYDVIEPIRLADVLRAISFIGEWNVDGLSGAGIHIACTTMGHFVDGYGNSLEANWDLTNDSLDEQSPDTLVSLSKLLV